MGSELALNSEIELYKEFSGLLSKSLKFFQS